MRNGFLVVDQTQSAIDRLRKGRELVRAIALLLSEAAPLEQLFERLTRLLAEFVDASVVLVAVGTSATAGIAYVYQDGRGGSPDDAAIVPGSTTDVVLRSGEAKLYATRSDWPSQSALSLGGSPLDLPESAIFVPILFGGATVGALSVQSRCKGSYDADDVALLETCGLYLGARIAEAQRREQTAQLEQMALTDALTGLANRRAFDDTFDREWRRCARSDVAFSVGLVDIDYFKTFNDTYGHMAGDACLRQVAQAMLHCFKRPGDLVARYGGEEFALIMPGTDADGALQLCESVCDAIRSLNLPHQDSSLGRITASVGVFTAPHPDEADPQAALSSADTLLYRAKSEGRNRVAAAGYSSETPPAHVRMHYRTNLPAPRNSFIGRESDLALIGEGLRRGRLVTIAGTGGVGKTRLALEVARASIDSLPNGVWFVDLATIADSSLVVGAIAIATNVNAGGSSDALCAIADQLRSKQLLLVVDNCEHVVREVARAIDALLSACPNLSVLTTSREPLHIAGEAVHRLTPFDETSAAVLFKARALDAGARSEFDAADLEAIVAICRRLDGLALAIELAAARARAMSPARILQLIDERFALLRAGNRATLGRHQTLRTLIDWSYDLLPDAERKIFARLAIFAGSLSAEAAAAVAMDTEDRWAAADALDALADKSMIVTLEGERYRLLDSLREYAGEKLRERGEEPVRRMLHARYYEAEAERLARLSSEASPKAWTTAFEADLDDYRLALDWAGGNDTELLARILGNVGRAWDSAGLQLEGYRRCETAVAALGDAAKNPAYVTLWIALSWAAGNLLKTLRSRETAEVALEQARSLNDRALTAEALQLIGMAEQRLGNDPHRAVALLGEALEIFRAQRKPLNKILSVLEHYASALERLGDLETARKHHHEVADLALQFGDERTASGAAVNLAEVEFALGRVDAACSAAERSVELLRTHGTPLNLANALANLASYNAVAGRLSVATEAVHHAVALAKSHDAEGHVAVAAQALALCEAQLGNLGKAATLLGFVDAVYDRRGAQREPTEAAVRRALVEQFRGRSAELETNEAMELGRRLDLDVIYRLVME